MYGSSANNYFDNRNDIYLVVLKYSFVY
jgi:hypothetical protein